MIILKAKNSDLLQGAKYSFLTTNYASGVTSLVVTNPSGYTINDYVLLGEFGSETAELAKITAISGSTLTVAATSFAHPESTKVTIIPYHQVKFYYTTTATFATTTLLSTINIQADDFYTRFNDGSYTTGFGWFVFYYTVTLGGSTTQFDITNTSGTTYRYTYDGTGTDPGITNHVYIGSQVVTNGQNFNAGNNGTFTVTAVGTNYFEVANASGVAENNKTIGTGSLTVNNTSSNSNAIPYADFDENSVKKIFDSFFSLLNNKERSLCTQDDAFRWLNEAYAIARNELNLINDEYNVESLYSLSVTSGTQEYTLPTDFGQLISIHDSNGMRVKFIPIKDILDQVFSVIRTSDIAYYIRGTKFGIVPTPSIDATYSLYYKSKATALTSLYDTVAFPSNNFYFLVDFMLSRAGQRMGWPIGDRDKAKANFDEGIARMKITSIKRSANLDTWNIEPNANV